MKLFLLLFLTATIAQAKSEVYSYEHEIYFDGFSEESCIMASGIWTQKPGKTDQKSYCKVDNFKDTLTISIPNKKNQPLKVAFSANSSEGDNCALNSKNAKYLLNGQILGTSTPPSSSESTPMAEQCGISITFSPDKQKAALVVHGESAICSLSVASCKSLGHGDFTPEHPFILSLDQN